MAESCRLCRKFECEFDLKSRISSEDDDDDHNDHNENDIFSNVKTYLDFYRLVAMTEVHSNSQISSKLCSSCSKDLICAYNFTNKVYHIERQLLAAFKSKQIKDYPQDPIEVPNNRDDLLLALRNGELMVAYDHIVNDVLLTEKPIDTEEKEKMLTEDIIEKEPSPLSEEEEEILNEDIIEEEASNLNDDEEEEEEDMLKEEAFTLNENVSITEFRDFTQQTICFACNGMELGNHKLLKLHLIHAHMTIMDNIKMCDLCGEGCRTKTQFIAHVRTHNSLPSVYKCLNCDCTEFPTQHDYMQHKIEQHVLNNLSENNNSCPMCNKEYVSLYNLRRHLIKNCEQPMLEYMSEVNLDDLSCKICNKKVTRLHSLLNHIRRHKQVRKTSTCEICGITFFLEKSMLEHKLQHEQDLMVFEEQTQSKENVEITTYNVEFTTAGENANPELKCEICNKQFVKLINLTKHMKIHEKKMAEDAAGPFSCTECEKIYFCKRALVQHLRRHFNAPFNCEYCDKKFINKRELQVHTRSHTRDYPFVCEICGQRYGVKSSLTEHLRRHEGVRYKCEQCGKDFKKSCSLREHIRLHTGMIPYPCVYCERAYTSRDKYRYHIKHKHKLELTDEEVVKSRKLAQQRSRQPD